MNLNSDHKDILIFVGHFGSGKTETALNYMLEAHQKGERSVLIDLDIVNPFFRSSDLKQQLNARGIEIIAPNFVGTTSDVPSLPGSIQGVFVRDLDRIAFDVGGDPQGAKVLSTYHAYFEAACYRMYLVINTMRPMTSTSEAVIAYMKAIESASRLSVTDLICNTNIADETGVEDVVDGYRLIREVSKKTGIPIAWVNIAEHIMPEALNLPEVVLKTIKPYMRKWHAT